MNARKSLKVGALAVVAFAGAVVSAAELHVSPSGSDETGDGSKALPFRTIQHAVDSSADHDWIYVAGGTYGESVVTPTYRYFSGSWNADFTARDLRNGRSVVISTSTASPCLSITAVEGTNVVSGFTFTGGSDGVQCKSTKGSSSNDQDGYYHIFSQLIVTNNVDGLDFAGSFPSLCLISSLVADNSGNGYYQNSNHGTLAYMYNCTLANNGKGICRDNQYTAQQTCRNCAFVGNDYAIRNANKTDFKDTVCYDTAFYGNGEIFRFDAGVTAGRNQYGAGALEKWRLRLNNNTCCSDPLLEEDFAPSADSPLRGLGADVSSYGVTEDVYGTAWNGVYDIGCVKSADAPERTRYDELWVSPAGNDANAGTDSEHPFKTVNAALARLADNGTCHLAAGTYLEPVAVYVSGAKLLGESADTTFVRPEISALDTVSEKHVHWSFGVGIFAPNVTVSNVTVRLAAAGFYSEKATTAGNTTITHCNANENLFGVIVSSGQNKNAMNTYSHMKICQNAYLGMFVCTFGNFIDLLIADNGDYGVEVQTASTDNCGSFIAHCTIVGNEKWGWRNSGGGSYQGLCLFANCIFADNASGGIYTTPDGIIYSCCFHNNGEDGQAHVRASGGPTDINDCIYDDPELMTSTSRRGMIAKSSPCARCAKNLDTWDYLKIGRGKTRIPARVEIDSDLAGVAINYKKPTAIGCYQPLKNGLAVIIR